MNRRNFAFDKTNFILLAAGMIVVLIGFILMSGSGSTEHAFDPNIFSARRIKVAPIVCLTGFIFMIFAILHYPKNGDEINKITDAASKTTASDLQKK